MVLLCLVCWELPHKGAWSFVVRKLLAVSAGLTSSGSFDFGAHGEAVSTFAQDDRVLGV